MPRVQVPNNWAPRGYQMPLWEYLERGGKRAVGVWHRRAGKDEVCLHWAAVACITRPATYWHMLPEASQARKAIWDAINPHTGKRRIDEAFPEAIRAGTREQEMIIRFVNGSTWQVVGSDNFDSLVGSPPAGVVFSEWALAKPDAWAYLRPILAENGGWALFIYTPRGDNHGKTTYEYAITDDKWFGELLTVDDTGVFDQETLASEHGEMQAQYGVSRGDALYKQEYYCSWSQAFEGRVVYPEWDDKTHISPKPLLPLAIEGAKGGKPIIRGWDHTGLNPACIVTYINSIGQWYWVKEFCAFDMGITDFAEMVHLWCAQAFPANTKFRDIGDPAGKQRDSLKGSPAEYIHRHTGIRIEDGIQTFKIRRESVAGRMTKTLGGKPGLLVDLTGCPMSIEGCRGGYCHKEIGETGIYQPEPQKNKWSHVSDAAQYVATILFRSGAAEDDSPATMTFANIASREKPKTSHYEVYAR